jgi:hypothetical protein
MNRAYNGRGAAQISPLWWRGKPALSYRARFLLPAINSGAAIAVTSSPNVINPAGVARAVASIDTQFPIRNRTVPRFSSG